MKTQSPWDRHTYTRLSLLLPLLKFSASFYSISDIIRFAPQGKLLLVLPRVNSVLQTWSPGLSLGVCFAASCLGALLGVFRVLWLQRLMCHQWSCVCCPFMKPLSQHPPGTWFLLCTQAGVSWAQFRDAHAFWPLSNEHFCPWPTKTLSSVRYYFCAPLAPQARCNSRLQNKSCMNK